ELGGRGRVCALVGRRCGELGLLAAELVQTSVEAGQAFAAAFCRELALFEGLEVALERLFGARDLGADRREASFERRLFPFRFLVCLRDRLLDQGAVAIEASELS